MPQYKPFRYTLILLWLGITVTTLFLGLNAFPKHVGRSLSFREALPLIGVALLICVACLLIMKRLSLWSMMAYKRFDSVALGGIMDSQRYVGVSYCDGDWGYRGDTSWDRGYLSVQDGALRFHGFAGDFALPIERIQSMDLHGTWSISTSSLPRVYVRWESTNSDLNTLSFEIREGWTRYQNIQKCDALLAWLQGGLASQREGTDSHEFPFASEKLDFSRGCATRPVDSEDYLPVLILSAIYIAASMLVAQAIRLTLHLNAGNFVQLVATMTLCTIHGRIGIRVAKRGAESSTSF